MFARLVAAIAPYLLWIMLALGLSLGGSAAWYIQSLRVESRNLRIRALEQTIQTAKEKAEADALLSEATIAELIGDLAIAHKTQRIEYVEIIKKLDSVASGTDQCLSPGTIGVLRGSEGRANPQGAGSRVAPDSGTRLAPDPLGPPFVGGGASEKAIANWMAAALKQYKDVQKRNATLAGVIRALPCVEVVPDE